MLEAKEDAGYNLSKALEEIQTARKNRNAQIGIFVFSSKSAPIDLDPFARYGDDLIVVWDANQNGTDVYLRAALSTARALCVRAGKSAENEVDFAAMNRAILEIEKRAKSLDEVRKSAETIQSASQRIIDRTQITQRELERQVALLNAKLSEVESNSNQLR